MDYLENKTGGPAHPLTLNVGPNGEAIQFAGLTMRDHFAAAALQGTLAGMLADGSRLVQSEFQVHAKAAYLLADAMLAERAK